MERIRIWWQTAMFSFFLFVLTVIGLYFDIFVVFDDFIIDIIRSLENPLLTSIFIVFTHLGSAFGMFSIFIILLYVFRRFKWRAESILLTGVIFATPIMNIILKELIQRPRPSTQHLIEIGGYSFPSGHTMYAVSLYGIMLTLIWFKLKKYHERVFFTIIIIFLTSMIALSRIYLGVHFPSDIIGGFFASVFIISLTFYIYLTERQRKRE